MHSNNKKIILSEQQLQWLEREAISWQQDGIIDANTQQDILKRYQTEGQNQPNTSWNYLLFISLGSLLIGGGIILLIAHNWDQFGKGLRAFLSFLPLVLAQGLCWFSVQYRPTSLALRESGAILLFFAVAASIALISQTYHIYGDLERFLVVWLLLTLPIVYLLRSATTLMLISGLILWLCCLEREPYWIFYIALAPYLYQLYRQKSRLLLHWALWFSCLSLTISVIYGSAYYASPLDHWSIYITLAMGCAFYAIGYWWFGLEHNKFWLNAPTSIGTILIGFVSLMFTWHGRTLPYQLWQVESPMRFNDYAILAFFTVCIIITVIFIFRYARNFMPSNWVALASFIFVISGVIGFQFFVENIYVIASNLYILVGSVILMLQGINRSRLMLLNGGLVWFSFLVLFRFFDSDISFVLKGLIFIAIGCVFIATNIWFRKKHQITEDRA